MAEGGRDKKPEQSQDAGAADSHAASAESDEKTKRLLMLRRRQRQDQAADAHNQAHAETVFDFNQLTGNACGSGINIDVSKLRAWQKAHGLIGDGKIGAKTLDAAKKEKGEPEKEAESGAAGKKDGAGHGKKGAQQVSFSDDEAGAVEGSPAGPDVFEGEGVAQGGPALKNPVPLAERVVERGETQGQERRAGEKPGEMAENAATWVPEGVEKSAEGVDAVEHAGVKGTAAVKGVAFLAKVPHLVNLLRDHKYGAAVKLVVDSVGMEERAEFLKAAVEKLGGEISERLAAALEKAVIAGAVADVLLLGWEWTKAGFEAIREAHEKGDQQARIGIYAFAWSDSALNGSHSNPGAITTEDKEARDKGVEDGLATREANPELPGLLLAEYGDKINARHALQDALYKSAGIAGVANHK